MDTIYRQLIEGHMVYWYFPYANGPKCYLSKGESFALVRKKRARIIDL